LALQLCFEYRSALKVMTYRGKEASENLRGHFRFLEVAFSFPHYLTGHIGGEMKSEFFSMFAIPTTECEVEARKDELGVPRPCFDQRAIRWSAWT
jgi:hypothetical protein